MAEKMDIVNERITIAQHEMEKRAKRLLAIKSRANGKKMAPGFQEGINLLAEMIANQSELYDKLVFEAPKTALEQQKNMMLLTGDMSQTVQQGIKPATDAIDSMLDAIEQMAR